MAEQQQSTAPGVATTNRRMGFLAVLGVWTNWFFWASAVKGLAVMLPTLQDQMDTNTWVIGWMIVVVEVTANLIGPMAAPLGRCFGIGACVMVSGLMMGVAFIIASFSSAVVMATVLAVLAGPGIGISNVLCKELLSRCFTSGSTTTAFSISQTGSSVAFIVMPPLTQLFLDTYGWRGAMLLLGSIFFHLTVCGALLQCPSVNALAAHKTGTDYSALPDDSSEEGHQHSVDEDASRESVKQENNSILSGLQTAWQLFLTRLLTSRAYWCVAVISIVTNVSTLGWAVYFVPHTLTKGFDPGDAVTLTSIMGLTRVLAGVILGPVMDKIQIVGNKEFVGIALTSMTVYYAVDPWLTSYWLNVAVVVIYACSNCMMLALQDVLLCEIVPSDCLGSAFGWIAMKSAVFSFFLLYLPGLIFDLGGSYTIPFLLMGGLHFFAIAAVLFLVFKVDSEAD
ncbi:monocarboxylate transporter 12-like [Acanthaster planci]|uniref:Monocarboxylate transporter 12-like n=1 Tax=Acanthaster planci TaxID=133434 RepID=A0A8B7ZKX3_ACAPL|nr:monocarboxylate transporter 12-like [Acanthaster planci]